MTPADLNPLLTAPRPALRWSPGPPSPLADQRGGLAPPGSRGKGPQPIPEVRIMAAEQAGKLTPTP